MTDMTDTPAGLIARLDAALARRGEDCLLRRIVGGVEKDVTIQTSVRAVRAEQLINGVTQDFSNVVASMTQVLAAAWPAGFVLEPGKVDPRIPRKNDYLLVKGKVRQIQFVNAIAVDNTIVRLEMLVAG